MLRILLIECLSSALLGAVIFRLAYAFPSLSAISPEPGWPILSYADGSAWALVRKRISRIPEPDHGLVLLMDGTAATCLWL